jgi:hypothetical protein
MRLRTRELRPGAKEELFVDMTTFAGDRITQRVEFRVPERLAGSIVRIEVSAGDAAELDVAPPESLIDLVRALKKLLPGDTLAVTLYSADEGVAVDGLLVRDLTPSAADRFKSSTSTKPNDVYRPLYRSLSKSTRVINGSHSLLVRVANRTN